MTKPNQERLACVNLQRQEFEYYWPRFVEKRPNKPDLVRSLFPRYLFILIDKFWISLTGTRGLSRVLLGENGPLVLPDREIDRLRSREGADGYISLAPPPAKFAKGCPVRASDGPLVGQLLIYQGMTARDRCRVLAQMLGGQVPVEIDEKTLVAA